MLDPDATHKLRQLDTSVHRSFDAAEANRIINHPSVFPNIATAGLMSIDLAPVVADHRNVLLMAHNGALIFSPDIEPLMFDPSQIATNGIYTLHTNFLKPSRTERQRSEGPQIRNICLNAYTWMFTHTDCMALVTNIPAFNRAAITFAPLLGWREQFVRKDAWTNDRGIFDLHHFKLGYDDWSRLARDGLIEIGRAFHEMLEREFVRHGVAEPQHPSDETHDLHVGICARTILAGQPDKAVLLYNRWARQAGYGQIRLVARSPLVVDIGNAVLVVQDGSFKVVTCRPQP